jgi:hypothetical protein
MKLQYQDEIFQLAKYDAVVYRELQSFLSGSTTWDESLACMVLILAEQNKTLLAELIASKSREMPSFYQSLKDIP